MKKLMLLLLCGLLLNVAPVKAQDDNAAKITEIETQIKNLRAELEKLKAENGIVLVDNEVIYVEYVDFKDRKDLFTGEKTYEMTFNIENKTDTDLTFQIRDAFLGDIKKETYTYTFSEEVKAKSSKQCALSMREITNGSELLKGLFKFNFLVFSWTDKAIEYNFPAEFQIY